MENLARHPGERIVTTKHVLLPLQQQQQQQQQKVIIDKLVYYKKFTAKANFLQDIGVNKIPTSHNLIQLFVSLLYDICD